jgi:D-alanyl-D-alanine carboxypeptidase
MRRSWLSILFLAGSALSWGWLTAFAATVAVDAGSGTVVSQDGAGLPHHPASLTKLMTAYVAFQAIEAGPAHLADTIVVSERAAGQRGSVLGLASGEAITLGEALRAMVVRSANDAAVAVAEHIAGSEPAFAARMSAEAQRLGMTASHFSNATGMTAPGHLSTPRDMAVLALAIERDFPRFYPLFSSRDVTWKHRTLPSVNGFLSGFAGAEGMKTGFTCPAGYNLVASARRGGHHAVAVIMGAASKGERQEVARRLMDQTLSATGGGAATSLVQLANLATTPPDLSRAACGGKAGGGLVQQRVVPGGWALELAFSRDERQARHDLAAAHRRLARQLAGGREIMVVKPFDGGLRFRGLIVGLEKEHAIATCLGERAGGREDCLVLNPLMVEGALEEERIFMMLVAR